MSSVNLATMLISLIAFATVCPGAAAETPVNELPLFGGREKTPEQRRIDRDFVDEAIRAAGSRKAAYAQLIDRGWIALRQGSPTAAIRRFNQAYLIDSDDARAFAGLGAAVAGQGQFDQAVELLETAVRLDGRNGRLASDLGRAYLLRVTSGTPSMTARDEDLQQALRALDRAASLDPGIVEIYVNRAIVQLMLGRREAAAADLRRAEAIDPAAVDPELKREVLGNE